MTDLISRADAEPKVKHDREWIIGCIKHDGFIKTDRFDKANQIILDALSADAVPQLKQTDTLIIADALRYLAKDTERHLVDRTRADALRQQFLKYGASMCKGGAE